MTGRIRKQRAFWSQVLYYMRGSTARAADEAIELADSALRTGERLAAETVHLREALAAERRHSASLTADLAESVMELLSLRATIRRLEGELTTAREQAAVHEAIAQQLRARLAPGELM